MYIKLLIKNENFKLSLKTFFLFWPTQQNRVKEITKPQIIIGKRINIIISEILWIGFE